ncbi:Histidine phosphatase superfamily clade-2 [Penicillium nucicola]|uniref:Histidine phosphatase superfamily clade-2 n=1 Tax=Penicillium nucicola TaxID=1850975 RepID=UPI00254567DD|nr:Histidine phosphatase superfamily clade-2 [Penicillium nucicola]KAJ5757986.1 Histidine phosphatase superfamily clade-2 [Penicillium nucicola]
MGYYSHRGEEESLLGRRRDHGSKQQRSRTRSVATMAALLGMLFLSAVYFVPGSDYEPSQLTTEMPGAQPDQPNSPLSKSKRTPHSDGTCNTVNGGYQCNPEVSHRWGQYSPYFSLAEESAISDEVPDDCRITFVQVLSRHGARYPTASKSAKYGALIAKIQANATAFKGNTKFLQSYNYTLGSDDLTSFGKREMVESGLKFYQRYAELTRKSVPFVRSSDSSRVVESGNKFINGFQYAKSKDQKANHQQPAPQISVLISEDPGFNNTLNHNTCTNFESSTLGDDVDDEFTSIFTPAIRTRLEANIPGVELSGTEVVYLMDMCPYDTVSQSTVGSTLSPFCDLFTEEEWIQYNYLQSLDKYYGYGAGNTLGPAQGVGFVNELIARLTQTPVHDDTSTNHTLDAAGAATFPLNYTTYADFSHDNGMIPIFFALGLYNSTATLPRTHVQSSAQTNGYSASWTVPFGARAYFEMMQCHSDPNPEPFVRALVNDRVVPLHGCNVDKLGRCRRADFVKGLDFARSGGNWNQCFV